MSEIRFITSSDEHLADQSPGLRKDLYRDSILEKLSWQGNLAKKFRAQALLRGGDFFHTKEANKNTMATLRKAIRIHRSYSCQTFALAGNHDMSKNDPESIARQPIGVMYASHAFEPLDDLVFESGSLRVRVVGVNYTTDLDNEGLRELVKKRPDDDIVIAFVHALASYAPSERFQSFFGENILDYRDLIFDGCPDVFVFGHYHKDQGIREHLGTQFVNLGAVSRGALTFENLERKPKVSSILVNSQGISIEEHIVPHADAADVFDLELKKQKEKERRDIDDFIQKFRSDRQMSSGDNLKQRIGNLYNSVEYSEDLKKTIIETLEAAEAGVLED